MRNWALIVLCLCRVYVSIRTVEVLCDGSMPRKHYRDRILLMTFVSIAPCDSGLAALQEGSASRLGPIANQGTLLSRSYYLHQMEGFPRASRTPWGRCGNTPLGQYRTPLSFAKVHVSVPAAHQCSAWHGAEDHDHDRVFDS